MDAGILRGLLGLLPISVAIGTWSTWAATKAHRHVLPAWRVLACGIVKVAHIEVVAFMLSYAAVFHQRYDPVFLAIYFAMGLHWKLFKDECISSYIESKVIDPTYHLGDNPYSQDAAYGGKLVLTALHSVFLVTAVFVVIRYCRHVGARPVITIFTILFAVLNMRVDPITRARIGY